MPKITVVSLNTWWLINEEVGSLSEGGVVGITWETNVLLSVGFFSLKCRVVWCFALQVLQVFFEGHSRVECFDERQLMHRRKLLARS